MERDEIMSNTDETRPKQPQAQLVDEPAQPQATPAARAANIARIAAGLMKTHDETFKELAK